MLDKTATAPMHSVRIPHAGAQCSVLNQPSTSNSSLPSRGTQIIIGAITTENVLAAGSCFTRELVSLISLPCVNCTDSMIPEQKIPLLSREGHVNPQSLLYRMQSELLP